MNLPNALSLLRILLVPIFVVIFFSNSPDAYFIAVFIFLFAGLTDILDGMIARKYNMITRLGRILDPLADKFMIFSALLCLSIKNMLPWWITIFYLIKEILQIVFGAVFYSRLKDVPSSNKIGKTATIIFYIAIVILILFNHVSYQLKISLFLLALIFALTSFVTYYFSAVKVASGKKRSL
ncbi:MAG: CDP-diacylglycerol--glycerol-3-phosphate 3-phosphatidyltransferase [Clostridiales bacterium]|nr:CDP-diacylglycerol--glycerol-3-phosphate 3-phosphatidyltransferase [Clostridiales bacterium]